MFPTASFPRQNFGRSHRKFTPRFCKLKMWMLHETAFTGQVELRLILCHRPAHHSAQLHRGNRWLTWSLAKKGACKKSENEDEKSWLKQIWQSSDCMSCQPQCKISNPHKKNVWGNPTHPHLERIVAEDEYLSCMIIHASTRNWQGFGCWKKVSKQNFDENIWRLLSSKTCFLTESKQRIVNICLFKVNKHTSLKWLPIFTLVKSKTVQ